MLGYRVTPIVFASAITLTFAASAQAQDAAPAKRCSRTTAASVTVLNLDGT